MRFYYKRLGFFFASFVARCACVLMSFLVAHKILTMINVGNAYYCLGLWVIIAMICAGTYKFKECINV